MKLTIAVQLRPTITQAAALRDTLGRANAACDGLSARAWESRTFGQYALHKLAYADTRLASGLSAQVVVRCIAKVADAYKLDKRRQRTFRPHGAIAYDRRILRWYAADVSIWTVGGREHIPFVCGARERALIPKQQGESDLVYRDGRWFLYTTVNAEEPPAGEPVGWLGIDLGIVNVATDSDGTAHSGAHLNALRHRHRRLRRKLQAKGTKGSRRLLRQRRRKEARFGNHVNHTISRRLVAVAQGTGRGIALEELRGIRSRVSARKPQRATLHGWSFHQLRTFIEYKARLAGVRVALVDPRNTSRTCPACGHVAKENRPDQSHFLCVSCGLAGLPDHFAAVALSRRASVNAPYCSDTGTLPVAPGQSPRL
jgi:putative transposase